MRAEKTMNPVPWGSPKSLCQVLLQLRNNIGAFLDHSGNSPTFFD
jgi:hypothetical protein